MKKLTRVNGIISRFKGTKVLVIGDVMLDEFVWGSVSRISPEAPVPVVWVNKETVMPGGASNVANNLATLGAKVSVAGVIGNDHKGKILAQELKVRGIDIEGLVVDPDRPTTLKTRVIANRQQVVRIDREKPNELPAAALERINRFIDSRIKNVDAVIIEDYGKGVITPAVIKKAVSAGKRFNKIITVDPKEEHFDYYKGVTALTPNRYEAQNMVGFKIKDDESLKKAGREIVKRLNCAIALITLGEEGMCLFEKGRPGAVKIPTLAQEVFDVSGAGDTVISAFTLSLCCGATKIEAAHIANCAAGLVVGKVGVAVVTPNELIDRLRKEMRS